VGNATIDAHSGPGFRRDLAEVDAKVLCHWNALARYPREIRVEQKLGSFRSGYVHERSPTASLPGLGSLFYSTWKNQATLEA
jgi:hypothetical protein